jgi:nitrogen regulatory protein P-II 1
MKLVTAVVPPHRVGALRQALTTFGVAGMTLSQVTGYGMEIWTTRKHRGRVYYDESVSNVRLEIVVTDIDAADVVNVILRACGSTSSGAGKVWTVPVDALARVRTAERGIDAL